MTVDAAGSYYLRRFEISDMMGRSREIDSAGSIENFDAKLIMAEWSLNESINSSCLSGTAQILDGVGLYYDFPLRGEEKLVVTYEDFFGEERTHELFIHAITNVTPAKENSTDLLTYTIHFVSASKLIADSKLIRKAYHGLISDMVTEGFEQYYTRNGVNTTIDVEGTEGVQSLIIPNYNGTEMMNFFARHAYGGSSTYRFFENKDGYHFKTLEGIVEGREASRFYFNALKDETPDGQRKKMDGIVDIGYGQPVDTLYDVYNGTYHKRSLELDYMSRKAIANEYDYFEEFPEYSETWGVNGRRLKPVHTQEFVNEYMRSGKNMLMIKDYPDADRPNAPALRPKTFMSELAPENWAISEQQKHSRMKIKIYGRSSIVAGSVIDVSLNELRPAPSKIDARTSGKYLVESVANEFLGDVFMQTLSISRSGTGL